jgi:hypothetical protein
VNGVETSRGFVGVRVGGATSRGFDGGGAIGGATSRGFDGGGATGGATSRGFDGGGATGGATSRGFDGVGAIGGVTSRGLLGASIGGATSRGFDGASIGGCIGGAPRPGFTFSSSRVGAPRSVVATKVVERYANRRIAGRLGMGGSMAPGLKGSGS